MIKLKCGTKEIQTSRPAFVMGILNATPDSFYKNSRGGIELAHKLIESGADILDIGAESTRPGYIPVEAHEEIDRLLPIIKEIRKFSDIPISIDTRKAEVMKVCAENGADIFNDVSALEDDVLSAKIVADYNLSVVLMHRWQETQELMNQRIEQGKNNVQSILIEMNEYFTSRISYAKSQGITDKQIILDPGIGFGKTFEENIALIKNSNKILQNKYPVLMALSRKRCIGQMAQRDCPAENRLAGTLAANMIAVQNGAKIVRVHDVVETLDTLNVMKFML